MYFTTCYLLDISLIPLTFNDATLNYLEYFHFGASPLVPPSYLMGSFWEYQCFFQDNLLRVILLSVPPAFEALPPWRVGRADPHSSSGIISREILYILLLSNLLLQFSILLSLDSFDLFTLLLLCLRVEELFSIICVYTYYIYIYIYVYTHTRMLYVYMYTQQTN